VFGGGQTVERGARRSNTTVSSGGLMQVENGGSAILVTVSSGGIFEWLGSAPVTSETDFLSGATVEIGSGYVKSGGNILMG